MGDLRIELQAPVAKTNNLYVSSHQTLKIFIAYPEQNFVLLWLASLDVAQPIFLAQGRKNPLLMFLIITGSFFCYSGILQTLLLLHVTVCQTDWFMWVLKGHLVSQPGYITIVKLINGKFNVGPKSDNFVSVQIYQAAYRSR